MCKRHPRPEAPASPIANCRLPGANQATCVCVRPGPQIATNTFHFCTSSIGSGRRGRRHGVRAKHKMRSFRVFCTLLRRSGRRGRRHGVRARREMGPVFVCYTSSIRSWRRGRRPLRMHRVRERAGRRGRRHGVRARRKMGSVFVCCTSSIRSGRRGRRPLRVAVNAFRASGTPPPTHAPRAVPRRFRRE